MIAILNLIKLFFFILIINLMDRSRLNFLLRKNDFNFLKNNKVYYNNLFSNTDYEVNFKQIENIYDDIINLNEFKPELNLISIQNEYKKNNFKSKKTLKIKLIFNHYNKAIFLYYF